MEYQAAITSQGQLTIPTSLRKKVGIHIPSRVLLRYHNGEICIRSLKTLDELAGALRNKTSVRLSDALLRKARESFARTWFRRGEDR